MNEINELHINSSLPMNLIKEGRTRRVGRWCYHCGDTLIGSALYRRWTYIGMLRTGCLCRSCEAIEAAQIAAEANEIEAMERRRDDE
jgi:hypothetical protein